MAKYYAVKKGFDLKNNMIVENLLFTSWAEVVPLVQGISKKKHGVTPEYKSFLTKEEAINYIDEAAPYLYKGEEMYPVDCLHCYVDGSYSKEKNNYSYGMVCVYNGKVIYTENGIGKNKEAVSIQQIGGELLGSMKALLFTKKLAYKKVVLFFDYKGVALHATGYWKRDNSFSEEYYQWMQKFFRAQSDIDVIFCKVDAHTGDDFNELADGLAKLALGIKPDNKFYKFTKKYELQIES